MCETHIFVKIIDPVSGVVNFVSLSFGNRKQLNDRFGLLRK